MTSFIPATIGQKLGMCIPGVGLYFLKQYDDMDQGSNCADALDLIDELIKPIKYQEKSVQELSLEERQEIMGGIRAIMSCSFVIQGLASVVTAVAIGTLGGIIATVAAIAAGLYGLVMFGLGSIIIYTTLNYPLPSPQPQTA